MNIILLSGGSGKRLWPLSNDIRSKQFIKIFRNEDGTYESMVQRVYRGICKADPEAKITIATAKSQLSSIFNQLGDGVEVSVEPCRRNTFPAIALATAYLHDRMGVSPEESVVVCPVDPYVESSYFEALKTLAAQADKGEANLVLMGIEPTYPSEKYGYIMPLTQDEVAQVSSFKEKPKADKAAEYISQGALWNGGVFAYKLRYVLDRSRELMGTADYQTLFNSYGDLQKISFDYAVVEHEEKIQVCRYRGRILAVGLLGVLGTVMGLASSVASKYLIDAVTGYGSEFLVRSAIVMGLMMLGGLVFQGISNRVSAKIHILVRNEMQHNTYTRILRAGWEALEPYRSGDLLN